MLHFRDHRRRRIAAFALILICLALPLTACNIIGYGAATLAGDTKKVRVPAQYTDLAGHSVAVLVNADQYILFRDPNAQLDVAKVMSNAIAENVDPEPMIADPRNVVKYQKAQPHWVMAPRGQLIRAFDVDRLIVVDLIEYRTHEPGNLELFQGLLSAQVEVYEAESDDPDQPAFAATVESRFPEESDIGRPNIGEDAMRLALLENFRVAGGGLFFDHIIEVNR